MTLKWTLEALNKKQLRYYLMNIRKATIKDLQALVEIYNQAITVGQKTADITPVTIEDRVKWFNDHTSDKYPIWVAEKDSLVLGYLTLSAYRPGRMALRYTAEISYYVHFEHHRQGVASNLLQYALDICTSLQIKNLLAILIDNNQDSIRLLKKYGFEKWGHMPRIADFNGVEVGHLYYGLKIE